MTTNPQKLDLKTVVANYGNDPNSDISVTIAPSEHPDAMKARLVEESKAASFERRLLSGLMIFAAIVTAISFFFIFSDNAEISKWARGIVSMIVTALLAFVAGRATSKR